MTLLDQIAAERGRVADLVADLSEADLATTSLCAGWSVREVAQHLLMPLVTPLPVVMIAMARSRFDFDRANLRLTARLDTTPVSEIVAGLRTTPGTPSSRRA